MGVDLDKIKPGDLLLVRDAFGKDIHVRAVSGLLRGHKFPIVRICQPDAWPNPDEDAIVPWPDDDILAIVADADTTEQP